MKEVFVLYDSGSREVIRVFRDMEKAIVTAMNRLTFFRHTCVGFFADAEEAIIEYMDHDTGELCALTIQASNIDEGI